MKNFKVVLSLLPVFALTIFIYFSTIGFSNLDDSKASLAKESKKYSTVLLWINLIDTYGEGCVGGWVTYCINGYGLYNANGTGFYIEVPCDTYIDLCFQTEKCSGSWAGYVSCNVDTYINVGMNSSNGPCQCDHK